MIKRKIYVVGGADDYASWMEAEIIHDFDKANLICFYGGEDVSPEFYGKKSHPTTSANIRRDISEQAYFKRAVTAGKPMIGICRGSQFLCAMNGGILIQDQENPLYKHPIETFDGKSILITSSHHQAQFPFLLPKSDYKILGWTNGISRYHYGESYQQELNPPVECEIVYYSKTKSIGIQGHPEWMPQDSETIIYLRDLLNKFLANKL